MILRKVVSRSGRNSGLVMAQGRGMFSLFGDALRVEVMNVEGEAFHLTTEERDVIEMVRLLRRAASDGRVSGALYQALTEPMRG